VLNHAHRVYYWRELADIPSSQKLAQPFSRGTAPAVALAVLEIMQRDPDSTVAFFHRTITTAKTQFSKLLLIGDCNWRQFAETES
jgi:mannose-1-phosphate guanylyltransferase